MSTDSLPDDVAALKAMVIATQAACQAAETEVRARGLMIEKLKYTIAKLRHERFGQSSERGVLLEQLELQLADMEEDGSEAQAEAQMTAAAASSQKSRCRPSRDASRRAGRCPSICRASASSIPHRALARAAAALCTSSART